MTTTDRVRDYAALVRRFGAGSGPARKFLSDNAADLAFLAYAAEIARSQAQFLRDDKHKDRGRRP